MPAEYLYYYNISWPHKDEKTHRIKHELDWTEEKNVILNTF